MSVRGRWWRAISPGRGRAARDPASGAYARGGGGSTLSVGVAGANAAKDLIAGEKARGEERIPALLGIATDPHDVITAQQSGSCDWQGALAGAERCDFPACSECAA